MQALFPDVDDRDDPEHPEHPMKAVGLVLMSADVLGTTESAKLALFAGYSSAFVSAITFNTSNARCRPAGFTHPCD